MKVAPQPFGSLCPGPLHGQRAARAAAAPGPSCSRPQPSLGAERPGLTATGESSHFLQDLPRAGQVLLKIRFCGQAHGLLGSHRNSHVSPGGLKSLGCAEMDTVGFDKGRGTAPV